MKTSFQSAPPTRGATELDALTGDFEAVSIRAPHAGGDDLSWQRECTA